jgi:cysteine-rich repeat protein
MTVIISPVEINMSKFNAGKASVLALTAVAVLASFLLGKSLTSVRANDHHDGEEVSSKIDGVCDTTKDTCIAGDFEHRNDTPTEYRWKCNGKHGGSNVDCHIDISAPICGNGIIDPGEQCDDSDTQNGDGCSSTCQTELTCNQELVGNGNCDEVCNNSEYKWDGGDCDTQVSSPTPAPTPETCVGDQHLDATGLKCVSFSGSGPAPRNDEGVGGAVLGASTGQVLGASTMAGTGAFDETLYSAIMSIGATLSAFGLKGLKKAKKISKK